MLFYHSLWWSDAADADAADAKRKPVRALARVFERAYYRARLKWQAPGCVDVEGKARQEWYATAGT